MEERTTSPRRCEATRVAEIFPHAGSDAPERIVVRCQKVLLHYGEHVYYLPYEHAQQFRWGVPRGGDVAEPDG